MSGRYVVDTNVLIAASAGDPLHPRDIDATPDDPALRWQVWQWLARFEASTDRLVLDEQMQIVQEYWHKLNGQDYGLQVLQSKWDTNAVDLVRLEYDADGHALLPTDLMDVVHDRADRKMVAACLEALHQYQQCRIAFAGDTDWHDWEAALQDYGVELEPVIEAWSRQRHAEKKQR